MSKSRLLEPFGTLWGLSPKTALFSIGVSEKGSKGFQKPNPWPDLLDASRATWARDIAAGAIRTQSAHIARVAGVI